jgi:hypothetical protein
MFKNVFDNLILNTNMLPINENLELLLSSFQFTRQ